MEIKRVIKGVKIGDKFKKQLAKGKFSICEVVDFVERKSIAIIWIITNSAAI